MRQPRVSIVMPVFNAVATVAAAVSSLRQQTFPDWELLAVDDGSTDGTTELLHALAHEEPRLQVLTQPHAGIVAALNTGLAAATGAFVARMDADDESLPRRLEAQVAWMETHPDTGLVGTQVVFGGDAQAAAGYALHIEWLNGLLEPEAIALARFIESPFAHPSVLFRRELIARHGGYRDGDFPEDYELWLRWMDAGVRMGKVPEPLLRWHDPPGRLSRTDPRYDPEAFFRCKAPYLARWLRQHMLPGRPLWIWGAGRPTRKRAEHLTAHGVAIAGYIDVDPKKVGRFLQGRPVIAAEDLTSPQEGFVVPFVGSRGARDLARKHLEERGFILGRHYLPAA